jgi:CRISPR-associated exonuclease Cas4
MFSEDQLLPISALQHLLFCERQCALIHVERQWAENRFTVEGQHLHRKAHHGRDEWRGDTRIVRGLWIRSFRLGLVGQADVVEFESGATAGRVTPIEYKRGRPKTNNSDRVQLCAQAMCLEEMLAITIDAGDLFYGKRQRRTHVIFEESLRTTTEAAAKRLHQMLESGETPPAVRDKKCDTCSLFHLCLPEVTQITRCATRFVGRQFAAHLRDSTPTTDLLETAGAPMQ